MMLVVYFEFHLHLQTLVLLRAPYFLLPPNWTGDKIFMASWFARHHNDTVVIDGIFRHTINVPLTNNIPSTNNAAKAEDSSIIGLVNFVSRIDAGNSNGDSNGNNSKSSNYQSNTLPVVTFYNNDNHRMSDLHYTSYAAGKLVNVGEYTIYGDNDPQDIIGNCPYNNQGQRDGLWSGSWSGVLSEGKDKLEILYDNDQIVNPCRRYYDSGNFRHYVAINGRLDNGVFCSFLDDADNSPDRDLVIQNGEVVSSKYYPR